MLQDAAPLVVAIAIHNLLNIQQGSVTQARAGAR
jgi:hypothetical protein